MPISWNEIRHNAVAFSKEWASAAREDAEAQTFWNEFFGVFGTKRRTIASFEEPVKKLSGTWGRIDLFWKGTLLVEPKSRGEPLDKAEAQAMDYIQALKNEGRDDEIPRYVIVSDFARIALHDLEDGLTIQFSLDELHRQVDKFAFIAGYKQHKLDDEDPINIVAVGFRSPDARRRIDPPQTGQKKYSDGEPLLKDGYTGLKQRRDKIPQQFRKPRLTEGLQRLVRLYETTGNKDEAAKWRKELAAQQESEKKPKP